MISNSDGEAICPRCGAKVLETDYVCPRCAKVLTWKRKPYEEEAPKRQGEESAAEVCKCGHPRAAHVIRPGADLSPCVKRECPCTAFTPQPTTPTEWRPTTRRGH